MRIRELYERARGVTLYRGISPLNKPRRYPGTYYTENPELAKRYSRGGKVIVNNSIPKKPFNIDELMHLSPQQKKKYMGLLVKFLDDHYPNLDPSDTQLYDNLTNHNVTDFSYPVQADVDFLTSLGYDSVYFSTEGGEKVDSWFIFD